MAIPEFRPSRAVMDLRDCGIREVPVIGRYDYQRAERRIHRHAHAGAMEICFLAKGRQRYHVGGRDYWLAGGDVFVTFPDEAHSTGPSPQEKGRLYWVQVRLPRRAGAFLSADGEGGRELARQLRALPRRHFPGDAELPRLLDEVMGTARRHPFALRRLMLQTRLMQFLLRVVELAQAGARRPVSEAVSKVLRHVESQLHRALYVSELAACAGLSMPRFKARFKQEMGVPPAQYVLRCKVEAARHRLERGGDSITMIAMDLGFSSSQYFTTAYKRFTGRAPREARRRPDD